MIVCSVQQAGKMYGGNSIFDSLSFEVLERDRIGLVGPNGCGKTTIMKLIAGADSPDKGLISLKKSLRVGYLAQIPQFEAGIKVDGVLRTAFGDLLKLEGRMKELEKMMESAEGVKLEKAIEEYGAAQERFTLQGGYEMDAEIAKIANGLQLHPLMQSEFTQLSGGEQTKVCLGMLLLTAPELLLLDEPTNHLDIDAVEWLEQFLKEYDGTAIVISHDRYFLDEIAGKIIDIEDGEAVVYHANYSGFMKEKEARLLEEFQAYQEQQKKIKKMKEAIKRLKEWANRANPPNEGLHRRARNMERALERMEKLKRPVLERRKIGLTLESGERSGRDVIVMEEVWKSFDGNLLFQDIHLHLQFQERIAIVGKNGSGKSTLLKIIQREMEADGGKVRLGSSVKIGYLSQHLYMQNVSQTVIEAFREDLSMTEGEARHVLARFLFYGPAVFQKVGQLSGGERMRLKLAQLMHQDINLLILDEPTNHLDIDSREVLEEALEEFSGTILAVSHDRYLLNKLFSKTCWLEDGSLRTFTGNYDWAKKKMEEARQRKASQGTKVEDRNTMPDQLPAPVIIQKADVSMIEKEMDHLDAELKEIQRSMEAEESLEALQRLYDKQTEIESRQAKLYEQMEELI
ncbi:ribosomal protection-like ABC-F family protein [Peribacillus kribbensis]|uniref:ribosomal protection-like ABC-F family protein n=1 Tax=Peribacillus kribbensis TaxID=356658 RepID=UPI00047D881F|nr:ABC-F type ribosomal protection protein [Peribacillus kribbensis]